MSGISEGSSGLTHISIPDGHILINHQWRATQLTTHLAPRAKIAYSDNLGAVDFYPSEEVPVLFISQADLIAGNSYKRKVVKFRKASQQKRPIVIAQKTSYSNEQFSNLQKFVCINLGLSLIPVRSIEEAAHLLSTMAVCESKKNINPFSNKPPKSTPPDEMILTSLKGIHGLGEKRALLLLETFGSLEGICNASEKMLAQVIGSSAKGVFTFFHSAV